MSNRDRIQVLDHGHLFVDGSSTGSSPQASPSSSRPASARVRSHSRPSSPGGASGSLASFHNPHTAVLDQCQLRRQKTHQQRKERSLNNIFSDPIIEIELGRLAEQVLKEDCAKAFREHIKNVGGRFSRLSFKGNVFSPEIVVPVINDFSPTRPSFAPINSHHNIVGLEPESSVEDVFDVLASKIIEPPSLFRIAARPADIKNISLHSGITSRAEKISYHQPRNIGDQHSKSAPHILLSVQCVDPAAASLSASDCQHLPCQRPISARSVASCNNGLNPSGLCLAGDGLVGRVFQMSGQGSSSCSAYVTAGTVISSSVVHFVWKLW